MVETTDITGTRKVVIISVVAGVIVMAIVAQFIPEARAYTVEMVKTLLAAAAGMVK